LNVDFPIRTFTESDEQAELGQKEQWTNPKDGKIYWKRTFKTVIAPADINFGSPIVTVTAKDKVGNDGIATRTIAGDTTPPTVGFSIVSGSNLSDSSSFDVMVYPRTFGDVSSGLRRDISLIRLYIGTNEEPIVIDEISDGNLNGWERLPNSSAFTFYKKTFAVSDLHLTNEGAVDLRVRCTDVGEKTGEGVLSFDYDKTPPTGMKITTPKMFNAAGLTKLKDHTDDITIEDMSDYLNQEVTFAGECTDNYKVNKVITDIYEVTNLNNETGTKKYTVTIEYDMSGDAKVTDNNGILSKNNEGKTIFDGVPSNFNFKVDTKKLGDGNFFIILTAIDVAGNSASSEKMYFKVLQDSDMPKISFNDVFGGTVPKNHKIEGMAFDDDGFDGEKYQFKYAIANPNENITDKWANDATTDVPNKTNIYSFVLPPLSGDDGVYVLWIQPRDKNGLWGKIYELKLNVSSSEMPVVGEIIVDKTANGTKANENEYAGEISISVDVSSDSGSKTISKIWYRLYDKTSVNPNGDNTADFAELSQYKSNQIGGWYIKSGLTQPAMTDTITIDTKKFVPAEGRLQIEIISENNEGVKSLVKTKQIIVDNKAPLLVVESPQSG
ncbi:MAG: hypothetical protein J6Y01_01765, partial [Spirochaetales bacterium]|nr:hypothetical protein [Spirochaetales bacterium]